MYKVIAIIVAITFSSCAGSRTNDWVQGCVFGIQDAAQTFGVPVNPALVMKYCINKDSIR